MSLRISWTEFKEQMKKHACRWCEKSLDNEPNRQETACMDGCMADYIKHCCEIEVLREKDARSEHKKGT